MHAGGVPSDAALVVSEGGGAALFAGDDLGEQLLLHDPAAGGGRVLASAAAPNTGGWLMLTELMGVVAYAPVPAPGTPAAPAVVPASAPPSESPSAPMSAPTSAPAPEPVAPANVDPVEAEAAVRAEFAAFASGSGGAPAEAGFRLRAAGALSVAADVAPFAANSRAIVDALPKHWSGPSGPGPAVEMHLDDKARRHDLFLQFLAEAAGVWNILPAGERETVLEHGELVAALLCVRSLHNEAAEAAEAGEEAAESAAALLREAAAAAARRRRRRTPPCAVDPPSRCATAEPPPPRTRCSPRWRRVSIATRGRARRVGCTNAPPRWRRFLARYSERSAPPRNSDGIARRSIHPRRGARRRRHPDGTRG